MIISLVVPASDVFPGQRFTITIQSESPITLQLDPRFERLDGGPQIIQWQGGGMLRLGLRVRGDAAPGLAWFEVQGIRRAVRVCCLSAPYPRRVVYLAVVRR